MTSGWAETHLGLIFQVYGLSFFVLGVVARVAMRPGGAPGLGAHLGWLAAFGMLHGVQEFVDGERLQNPAFGLVVLSCALMVSSFAALLEFGRRLWNERADAPRVAALPLYAIAGLGTVGLLLSAPTALAGVERSARYLLGAPGAALAAVGLLTHAGALVRTSGTAAGIRWLRIAALAMFAYAALTLFVSPGAVGEVRGWLPTTADFLAVTGLPVQLARTLCAVVLAVGFAVFTRKDAVQVATILRRVTDNLDGFVYQCRNSPDWAVTFMSEGGEILTGYPAGAFLRGEVHFADLIHPDDRDRVWDEVQAALAARRDFQLKYRMVARTGIVRWCYEEGRGVFDPEGELLYLEGLVRDDGEHHRAEAGRRRMEELVEASPQPIGWAGSDGVVRYFNRALRTVLAVPEDAEVSQYRLLDFYDDEAAEVLESTILPVVMGEGAWTGEVELRALDGRSVPTLHSVFRLQDALGETTALANVLTDLSEIREVERELLILGAAVETATSAIALSGPDGMLTYVNQAFVELWRLNGADDAVGRSALDFWQEPDQAAGVVDALVRTGRWTGVLRARRADGSLADVELTGHMVLDTDGRPLCMMGSFVDITDRVRMEGALRESEARLVEAQRIAQLGSWELDVVGGKLIWSAEVFRIFELDPAHSEASYEGFLAVVHPDDRELVDEAYQEAVSSRLPYRIEHRLLMKDGRVKWVKEVGETLYGEDGAPLLSRGTVQDITFQKQVTLQREAAIREKESLVREVHHRVKNNLQVISSFLHLKARRASDPQVRTALEEGRQRIVAMAMVHESLYQVNDLSKISFHDYLPRLIAEIGRVYAEGTNGIRLPVDVVPCWLSVDQAVPLGMIVNELVSNALKHAFPGEPRGGVRTTLRVEDGLLTLTVADDGIGFPAGASPEDGSSFGWQLIPALVRQLRGRLEFGAGPDSGFAVSVTVPIGEASIGKAR